MPTAVVRLLSALVFIFSLAFAFVPAHFPFSTITRMHSLKPQNPFQLSKGDGEGEKSMGMGMGIGGSGARRGHGGRGGKMVPLENRRGARPLNKAERKAKELYEGAKLPEVQR